VVLGNIAYNLFIMFQSKGRLFEGLEGEPLFSKMLIFIIGIKVDPNRLKRGSYYLPLEYFSKSADAKVVRYFRRFLRHQEETLEIDDCVKTFSRDSKGKIWSTPSPPFLVFVAGGFGAAPHMCDVVSRLRLQIITAGSV